MPVRSFKGPMMLSPRSQPVDAGTCQDSPIMSDAVVETSASTSRITTEAESATKNRINSAKSRKGAENKNSSRTEGRPTSSKQRRRSNKNMGTRMTVQQASSTEGVNEAENSKSSRKDNAASKANATTPVSLNFVSSRKPAGNNPQARELRKSHPSATKTCLTDGKEKRNGSRTLKAAHSCPTLTDLSDLKLECNMSKHSISRGKKHSGKQDPVTQPTHVLSRHLGKLHRTSSNVSRYTIAGALPTTEHLPNKPPKPPSWQNFVDETNQNKPESSMTFHPKAGELTVSRQRCAYCKEQYSCCHSNEHRRIPATIRRTRSLLTIDERELPETELVISLSETKPAEFNLKETIHDDRIYLRENDVRCRRWLETVQESDIKPHELDTKLVCSVEVDDEQLAHLQDQFPLEIDTNDDEMSLSQSSSICTDDDDDDDDEDDD